ncbi:MAG: PEP-CTERM sorting domain-containing protein [Cyanobacteriota bacterium]|nr:PEP-CTERM sorting domain-containing protein [Cyanobacteriota bacterium]
MPTKENSADKTYQYSSVSNLPAPEPQQPEDTTIEVEDPIIPPDPVVKPSLPTPPTITIPPSNQTKPPAKAVAVPEPGSLAAIAIFGLGGLLGKKKKSS